MISSFLAPAMGGFILGSAMGGLMSDYNKELPPVSHLGVKIGIVHTVAYVAILALAKLPTAPIAATLVPFAILIGGYAYSIRKWNPEVFTFAENKPSKLEIKIKMFVGYLHNWLFPINTASYNVS